MHIKLLRSGNLSFEKGVWQEDIVIVELFLFHLKIVEVLLSREQIFYDKPLE